MDLALRNVWVPDFRENRLVHCHVGLENGLIAAVSDTPMDAEAVVEGKNGLLTPGLMDAHVHMESALLTPTRFGETVARHGTLHVVADCHEIANVAGISGLRWFMDDAGNGPINAHFAVPSSVPATPFAQSGGELGLKEVTELLDDPRVVSLGELMNVPGVDDHETSSYQELKERLELRLHVFLREGSAEHTEEDAYRIIDEEPHMVMFCTDDKALHDIETTGHITFHLRKGARLGVNIMNLLRAACFNGPAYYHIPDAGEVRPGARADLVLFDNARDFNVKQVIVKGRLLGNVSMTPSEVPPFLADSIQLKRPIEIPPIPDQLRGFAIDVTDGSLLTGKLEVDALLPEISPPNDLLKLVVLERYGHGNRAACRIHGFGLEQGAIASSLAHDCHNIIAVGVHDDSIRLAVEGIIRNHGGLSIAYGEDVFTVPLPVGGIVSSESPEILTKTLEELARRTRKLGTGLRNAHATLSFMALEVIPHLKLTDQGLFDVDNFQYVAANQIL
ncbi:MAG: hypothetical protein B1H13_14330 [Desulfobacteraceae bacterium 4484_190.3]|nr:MAG: hypothetical protein B1H13_14330 [Desulfobacteraceae bacterium 4484_190.3]